MERGRRELMDGEIYDRVKGTDIEIKRNRKWDI